MKKAKIIAIGIAVVVLIGVASVVYYAYLENPSTLDIKVMDAPITGVSAVNITFNEVQIHGTSSGWTTYSLASKTIDILGLTTSNASLFATLSLSAQRYTQIRMHLESVTVVILGKSYNFTLVSNWADIIGTFNISAHSTTTLTIAFNLNQELNVASSTFTQLPLDWNISQSVVYGMRRTAYTSEIYNRFVKTFRNRRFEKEIILCRRIGKCPHNMELMFIQPTCLFQRQG